MCLSCSSSPGSLHPFCSRSASAGCTGSRRVGRWAQEHGLTLLEFRGARFFEGPRALRRSDNQFAFHVVVEDASGRERTGWLTFGSYWSFWPTGRPEIRWES